MHRSQILKRYPKSFCSRSWADLQVSRWALEDLNL